jgi:hypothetical protein
MFNFSIFAEYALKSAVGIVVGGFVTVLLWPIRKMKKEWVALKEEQSLIHEELTHQRVNHLTHIEEYGRQQTELLGKVVDTLNDIRISQSEMTGFCKANAMVSACKPRKRKK